VRVDITFTYHCDIVGCRQTDTQHWENIPAGAMPVPVPPLGWAEVGKLVFCSRHTMLLQIDGQDVTAMTELS